MSVYYQELYKCAIGNPLLTQQRRGLFSLGERDETK